MRIKCHQSDLVKLSEKTAKKAANSPKPQMQVLSGKRKDEQRALKNG